MKGRKKYLFVVLSIFMIFLFGACLSACKTNEEFVNDEVSIKIKADYKEKFLNKEFTLEDFGLETIEKFTYEVWYDSLSPECGFMTIYLNKKGMKYVEAAIKHLEQLDFVVLAEKIGYIYAFSLKV